MDFEDFFEKKSRHGKKYAMHNYSGDNSYGHKPYSDDYGSFNPMEFINSLRRNKKLKIAFLIVVIILIALVIAIVAILFPLIKTVINYITQNGFSGVFDKVIDFFKNF